MNPSPSSFSPVLDFHRFYVKLNGTQNLTLSWAVQFWPIFPCWFDGIFHFWQNRHCFRNLRWNDQIYWHCQILSHQMDSAFDHKQHQVLHNLVVFVIAIFLNPFRNFDTLCRALCKATNAMLSRNTSHSIFVTDFGTIFAILIFATVLATIFAM